MGLNAIRLEGKSEGEEFYEYCDQMGILIISGWNCAMPGKDGKIGT